MYQYLTEPTSYTHALAFPLCSRCGGYTPLPNGAVSILLSTRLETVQLRKGTLIENVMRHRGIAHILSHSSLQSCEIGLILTLQARKREPGFLAWGYTASKRLSWNMSPGCLNPKGPSFYRIPTHCVSTVTPASLLLDPKMALSNLYTKFASEMVHMAHH